MAHTFNFSFGQKMELGEYIEFVRENVDPRDEASICESAWALHALSLDGSLFENIIGNAIREIAEAGVAQEGYNQYTDATFMLYITPDEPFFVRANVWRSAKAMSADLDLETRLYAYETPHDHNFDFVTVGYFGDGYETEIYEYDHDSVEGYIGEYVDLRFLERTFLPEGKVMMFRRRKDVHIQMPPKETSISLNLMISPTNPMTQQFGFDLNARTISEFIHGNQSKFVSLIDFAGEIGGQNAIEPLLSLATKSFQPRLRASAIRSISMLDPTLTEMLVSRYGKDSHPLVREALVTRK